MRSRPPQHPPGSRRNAAEAWSSAEEADEPVSPHSTLTFQVGLILLLLGAAGVYGWKSWRHYDPDNGVPARAAFAEMDEPSAEWFEHRRRRLTETLEGIGLDADQWSRIRVLLEGPLPAGREGWRERVEQVRRILTAQQLLRFEETLELERQRRFGNAPQFPQSPAPETGNWSEPPPPEENPPTDPARPRRLKHRG